MAKGVKTFVDRLKATSVGCNERKWPMMSYFRSPWMPLVTAVLIGMVVVTARGVKSIFAQPQSANQNVIAQPTGWVAFEAESLQTTPNMPDWVGTFYRSSNGSERHEQISRDGKFHMLTIINVAAGWQYGCNLIKNACMRFALTGLPVRPLLQRTTTMKELRATDQQVEGFGGLFEYTTPTGGRELQVPALNFAAVVLDDPKTGVHRTLHHIRLREPDPALFDPPAGLAFKDVVKH
jgi:hypothetical protein